MVVVMLLVCNSDVSQHCVDNVVTQLKEIINLFKVM